MTIRHLRQPKGELPVLGDLGTDRRPSGMLAFLRWSPTNELGSISEGGSLSEGPIPNKSVVLIGALLFVCLVPYVGN